jgi:Terminase large subunit, T4likevirus-type, N-terminal
MSNKIIDLKLPALHPAQAQIVSGARRFNIICCGRRLGKTVLGMDRLIHTALQGKPVAWFGPTYKSVADTWRELCSLLADITCSRNEQEKRLELLGGGVIDVWSLDSPDAGRGRKYALVVIDEAAMIPNLSQVWQESIRPTLTDLHGSAWILSTPRGMNDFKTLFDVGQDCERQDWISWQMPTAANPFMDPAEIDAARQDLTEAAFNQEYLAQFIDSEGSVFRRVFDLATADPKVKPETGHEYIDRSNHVDYALQRNRLRALCETWQPKRIIAEQNSIGQPIIEQLRREGLRIEPFTTTNASKTIAIEGLALAFERGDIQILNHPVLVNELIAWPC